MIFDSKISLLSPPKKLKIWGEKCAPPPCTPRVKVMDEAIVIVEVTVEVTVEVITMVEVKFEVLV